MEHELKMFEVQTESLPVHHGGTGNYKKLNQNDEKCDNEESNNYDLENSEKKFCPCCEKDVFPISTTENSFWSFLASIGACITCGWIALCVIPFFWPLLQYSAKTCPHCNHVFNRKSRIRCFQFREKIVTIKVGSCAVVLSRTYVIAAITLAMLISLALLVRWYISIFGLPEVEPGVPIQATWTNFLEDCGSHTYLGNPIRVEQIFLAKYSEKTVTWKGRMHRVAKGLLSKNFIYINMMPPYYHKADKSDLLFLFDKQLNHKISTLEIGDELEYIATLIDLGRRGRPHLGVLFDFNVTRKNADIKDELREIDTPFIIIQRHISSPFLPQLTKHFGDSNEFNESFSPINFSFQDIGLPLLNLFFENDETDGNNSDSVKHGLKNEENNDFRVIKTVHLDSS